MLATNAVWKFELKYGVNELLLPINSRFLHVHEQHGIVCVWAEVNPLATKETRRLRVVFTGEGFASSLLTHYIGTAHLSSGELVCHVFEVPCA